MYSNTRTPTTDELDTCKWTIITSEADWDLHSPSFHEQELNAKEFHNLNEYNPYMVNRSIHVTDFNRPTHLKMQYIELTLARSHSI